MIADKIRTESYRRAIFKTVKPGDVVLDLGTGTGILAYFACQAGAKKVYAIDFLEETIGMAKQIGAQNSFRNRVRLIQKLSHRACLPERTSETRPAAGRTGAAIVISCPGSSQAAERNNADCRENRKNDHDHHQQYHHLLKMMMK
jgi:ribosomal protein L11 methylase PrmA